MAWAGTRTSEYEAMVRLFREGLGLRVAHEQPDFAGFLLPNGDKVEVFGPSDTEHTHFDSGPVVGFRVDDVATARAQLEATGIPQADGAHTQPDGDRREGAEITRIPARLASERLLSAGSLSMQCCRRTWCLVKAREWRQA